jgi:hypothetical protein
MDTPLCKCGCGKKVKWSKTLKKYNDFVNGHNSSIFPKDAKYLIKKKDK